MTSSENPILVLIDVDPSGYVASSTAALLGAASTIGSPVALIVGGAPPRWTRLPRQEHPSC